jgi:sugar porter (SP) family MFS transporter
MRVISDHVLENSMVTTDSSPTVRSGVPSGRARTVLLYTIAALAALLVGYDLGVMAGAILFIKKDLGLDAWAQGFVVSVISLAAMPTALTAGPLMDRFGRRRMLIAATAVLVVASLGCAVSTSSTELIAFRILVGVGTTMATTAVPTYLAELAPSRSRGGITALYQLMWAAGSLIAFLVDYALAGHAAWRIMIGVSVGLALLIGIGLFFQPESPRWLARQGRHQEALAALRISNGTEADAVLAELSSSADTTEHGRWRELFASRTLLKALALGCTLAVLQQAIGVNAIVQYAPSILKSMGFGTSTALLNSVGLGAISVVSTLVAIRLMDRVGRRRLLITGAVVMATAMTTMAVVYGTGSQHSTSGKVAALVAIAVFKSAFSLSWGPAVWVCLPELFPSRLRGAGMGVAVLFNNAANFLVVLVVPDMLLLGPTAMFAIFAGFGLLAGGFAWRLMTELRGRSLEDISTRTVVGAH